ncbi:hypothetical protein GCM10023085_65710 [Actinomadura viridis]|uniref:CU044_5270 family protein n=1 Tax=Actinomadura viridis TaxID=58110 RepID=A0A931DQQ7_9ACTN|nr:CU044_5270 family protein [Actinomadura viridis]MBG6093013.1 hypothetical protein [Actinomadura viridis]
MDELRMVAELLDEGGPSPRVTAAGREGLHRLAHPAVDEVGTRRAGRLGRLARRPFRIGLGLGLVAAAAATAVAIAALGPGGVPGTGGEVTLRADGAKQMVLAAATQAERQTDDRYLVTHSRDCHAEPVRAKTGNYFVQPCWEMWRWQARDRANDSAIWSRDLPARPQTAEDEKLWKRAGSPTTFPYHDDPKALPKLYRTKPTPWKEDPSDRNENEKGFFLMGLGRTITAQELQNLPTDPKELEKILTRPERAPKPSTNPRARRHSKPTGPGQKIVEMGSAVSGLPLPPKVWAAFIRMLADTPGIQAVGRVTDPLGRPGVALEAARTGGPMNKTSMERIIFDPKTGALLAEVSTFVKAEDNERNYRPGTVTSYSANIETRWTGSRPTSPKRD